MSWLSDKKEVDYDIFVYGLFCTPCLFGENAAHVQSHPSCISQSLAYIMLNCSSYVVGSAIGNLIVPHNPYVLSSFGILCSSMMVGMLGGDMRTKLREKYYINGNKTNDSIIHCMCSPCAVCQEAQEIRLQNTNIIDHEYHQIPDVQSMKH